MSVAGKQRICFVTNDFAGVIRNGGIGTHFLLMSGLLAARGWDVHVLFCGPVDNEDEMRALPARLAEQGITFEWLNARPDPDWYSVPQFGDVLPTLVASQRVFEALQILHSEHSFGLIEFSDWGALGFRAVQAKRAGLAFADTRLAVKLHSTTEWQRRGNLDPRRSVWDLKLEYCERYAFEHADVQLSPSRFMLNDTREAGWNVRDDAVVASPYPDPDSRAGAPRDASISELAFFGRLERQKGLDIFLDALDELPADYPVTFIGREAHIDGRRTPELIAERMGGRPYQIETTLDRDAAIGKLLEGGRLAIMASQNETFGFTVAECVVNRIPFLAADVGGIPEVVAHDEGRASWLFEPTTDGLVQAIRRRLAEPEAAQRILRDQVATACDPRRWNHDVAERYRAVLDMPTDREPTAGSPDDITVTVAVTHYNHAAYLPAALSSLAAQTRPPEQVLVIDDGSPDEQARRVFDAQEELYPSWTFLRQENAGPGAARNVCLARATSTHFLPFDSDNLARPDLVEVLVAACAHDGRDAATCEMLAFVDEEEIAAGCYAFRYAPTGGPRLLTVLENVFGDTCGLVRSEALRAVGGFETARRSHEDWETYTKLAFSGFTIDVVPLPLVYYRTEIGGRQERLTADPARAFRLQRRMVQDLLADQELTREERIILWECLVGFAEPSRWAAELRRSNDEVVEWAHRELAAASAWHESEVRAHRTWHESEMEGLRAHMLAAVDQANISAQHAQADLCQAREELRRLEALTATAAAGEQRAVSGRAGRLLAWLASRSTA